MVKLTLPTDSNERKDIPLLSGCMNYFPAALAGVARISKAGNGKHNPGQPLHHARGKSMDHGDCIIRHTMDLEDLKAAWMREPRVDQGKEIQTAILDEARQRAWRALADLQELEEKFGGAPLAPAARLSTNPHLLVSSALTATELMEIGAHPGSLIPVMDRSADVRAMYARIEATDRSLEVGDRDDSANDTRAGMGRAIEKTFGNGGF